MRLRNFEGEPLDICRACARQVEAAKTPTDDTGATFRLKPANTFVAARLGVGEMYEDSYNCPPYSDCGYNCDCCGKPLTDRDN